MPAFNEVHDIVFQGQPYFQGHIEAGISYNPQTKQLCSVCGLSTHSYLCLKLLVAMQLLFSKVTLKQPYFQGRSEAAAGHYLKVCLLQVNQLPPCDLPVPEMLLVFPQPKFQHPPTDIVCIPLVHLCREHGNQ